ncbi:hypothetical protein LI90_1023 [Carbonactinospora thermoautotrophica]|uniref:Uncharacterized protein n=1 Tax=Carbonactinospora thermoautotrophica TaxID=1469144 RepID=A0A132MNG1_9ACTN|nr:hypothetical protein LI90_1023 [Carbonactinospora thermoautotrophica]
MRGEAERSPDLPRDFAELVDGYLGLARFLRADRAALSRPRPIWCRTSRDPPDPGRAPGALPIRYPERTLVDISKS